jgi:hypothetical protein
VAELTCVPCNTRMQGRDYQMSLFRCLSRAREVCSELKHRTFHKVDLSFIDCHGFKAHDGR